MRALTVSAHGGLEQLQIVTDLPVPPLGSSTDVRVRIHAVALNHLDLFVLRGLPGMTLRPRETILGGDAQQNADRMRSLLAGQESGPLAEMVALNAGAALYVTGRADGVADGVRQASEALRTGRAAATLDALATRSRALAAVTA